MQQSVSTNEQSMSASAATCAATAQPAAISGAVFHEGIDLIGKSTAIFRAVCHSLDLQRSIRQLTRSADGNGTGTCDVNDACDPFSFAIASASHFGATYYPEQTASFNSVLSQLVLPETPEQLVNQLADRLLPALTLLAAFAGLLLVFAALELFANYVATFELFGAYFKFLGHLCLVHSARRLPPENAEAEYRSASVKAIAIFLQLLVTYGLISAERSSVGASSDAQAILKASFLVVTIGQSVLIAFKYSLKTDARQLFGAKAAPKDTGSATDPKPSFARQLLIAIVSLAQAFLTYGKRGHNGLLEVRRPKSKELDSPRSSLSSFCV